MDKNKLIISSEGRKETLKWHRTVDPFSLISFFLSLNLICFIPSIPPILKPNLYLLLRSYHIISYHGIYIIIILILPLPILHLFIIILFFLIIIIENVFVFHTPKFVSLIFSLHCKLLSTWYCFYFHYCICYYILLCSSSLTCFE
jgi:hypothetical protein